MKLFNRFISLTALIISLNNPLWAQATPALQVMAAHPVLVGLAENLTNETKIKIHRAAPENLPASRQLSYINGRGAEKIASLAQQSDAVLSIRSIWLNDQLYPIARRSNIRLVEIDVAQPIDGFMPGITLTEQVSDGNIAQPWLDPRNLGRMADIIADELARLVPEQRQQLEKNLIQLKQQVNLFSQKAETQLAKFDEIAPILILSPQMNSLVNAYSLEYYPYFNTTPQSAEIERLNDYLQKNHIRLALSHVQPESAIDSLLAANNIQILVIPVHFKGDPITHLQQATEQLILSLTPANNKH